MYFTHSADSDLLPLDAQGVPAPQVDALAEDVQDDIIGRYTVAEGDGEVVKLEGYDTDPQQATPPLRKALRRTIAEVVGHRLRHQGSSKGVDSKRMGRITTSFNEGFNPLFPASWRRRLTSFDTRDPLWRA